MQAKQTKRKSKCQICGHEAEHELFYVKEMFFGKKGSFAYFKCNKCECLQILEMPNNMEAFYGSDYYSFTKLKTVKAVAEEKIEDYILDVGCGSGKWLIEKYEQGNINLYGCDPFIAEDIQYGGGCISIRKCTIHEMEGIYDFIRLSDSFEHMPDPYEVLLSVNRLLNEKGICTISMPIYPNAAFDLFGTNWYEWDAPRHLFIHSIKSMEYLCQKSGLKIQDVNYNSSYRQFVSSLLYQQGVSYLEQDDEVINKAFSAEQLELFKNYAAELNKKGYGDHAVFVLGKR